MKVGVHACTDITGFGIIGHLSEMIDREYFVILGAEKLDDVGIYKISEDTALVQALDYFTPIVKDPCVFGQIAAAAVFQDRIICKNGN